MYGLVDQASYGDAIILRGSGEERGFLFIVGD